MTYFGEASKLIINSSNSLLDRLLKCPSNTHDFTDTLHAATEQSADSIELLEIPSRNFDNHVIQTRLETCARNFRDGIFDFVKRDTETQFCSDECEWVSSRL